jgi:LysR family transcriptional regulator, regulator of abg operon
MNLEDLHLALVIAREGNLAAASQVLGVSQPTLSKAVARLERETRVQLFERVARGMRPTELGRAFLERALHIDLAAADMHAALRDLRQARAGVLRFGVGQGISDEWIAPAVRTLADAGVRFEISGGMPDALLPRVGLGELEFCLSGMSAPPREGLSWEPLAADPIVVLAPTAHPLAQGRRRPTWKQLAQARWIVPARQTSTHDEFRRNFKEHDLVPEETVVSLTSQRELALGTVLNALVLTSRSRLDGPSVRNAYVVLEPPGGWKSQRQAALVWRANGYISPAAERAMALLRQAIATPATTKA